MMKRILILVVICLFSTLKPGYSLENEYPISLDSIKFELSEDATTRLSYTQYYQGKKTEVSPKFNEDQLPVSITYLKEKKDLGFHGGHYIAIKDNNNKDVDFGVVYLYYNSKTGIIYGKTGFVPPEKKRFFRIGTAKIIDGKFSPTFIEGVKFTFHPKDASDFMDQAIITIQLPCPVEELLLDENK